MGTRTGRFFGCLAPPTSESRALPLLQQLSLHLSFVVGAIIFNQSACVSGTCCQALEATPSLSATKRRRTMLRFSASRATQRQYLFPSILQRWIHSRNKKAMEFIAKGWNALQEVDRVIDYTEPNDPRLFPYFRTAKENFELALEADNSNTHARYWLSRLHLKYQAPGACKAVGTALLVEAANMGDPDAQYELGCRLRVENKYVQSDQQAFYYLEKAVDQLHPGALYLLGAVYLAGDCVSNDIDSAMWCFHRASEKGHAGAAIACGSLILRGAKVPDAITKFNSKRLPSRPGKKFDSPVDDPVEKAKKQFQIAANSGCDLGLQWLKRLADNEKQLQTTQ